jgi:hypothetical protein
LIDRYEVALFGKVAKFFEAWLDHWVKIKRAISESPMALLSVKSIDAFSHGVAAGSDTRATSHAKCFSASPSLPAYCRIDDDASRAQAGEENNRCLVAVMSIRLSRQLVVMLHAKKVFAVIVHGASPPPPNAARP